MVNIPRSVSDEFYRYQMPEMNITYKRGLKTIIDNLSKVSKSLNCHTNHISKYFEHQLGTQCLLKPEGHIYNGVYDISLFQKHLDKFIDKYILCHSCGLPEIIISKTSTKIKKSCNACGEKEYFETTSKFEKFMFNNL
jgi:translation initiation factor 5